MNTGVELFKKKKFKEALEYFSNKEDDEYELRSYYLGLCHTRLKQYDEALIHLDEFINTSGSFSMIYQARMVIGLLYVTTGRYRLAEFEYQKLLEDGYDSSKVRAALGYIYYKQGNTPASIQNLEKARSLDPENSTALNSLAYILASEKIQIPLALRYIQEALRIRPKNPAYLDTLGWVFYMNGEQKKAQQVLKKALELAPRSEEIQLHYEQVFEKKKT